MAMNETTRTYLERIIAFAAGALLVFAIMSLGVVNRLNEENAELSSALDASQNEAGRLLADAKALFASEDYTQAKASLEALFDKQPGSAEAAEGKQLLAEIEAAEISAEEQWQEVLPAIREAWMADMQAELQQKWDAERAKLEANMSAAIEEAWEQSKDKVRAEWVAQQ